MNLKKWTLLKRTQVLKNKWIDVVADQCQTSRGIIDSFYLLRPNNWCLVMAQNLKHEWIVVHQYRHGLGDLSWEFCAGVIDEGENPLTAAKRELKEETGYGQGDWTLLGTWPCNPANLTNEFSVFLAKGVVLEAEQDLDPFEEIEVHCKNEIEINDLIDSKVMQNPFHIMAWLLKDKTS